MRKTFLLLLSLFLAVSPAGADPDSYETELVVKLTESLPASEFVRLEAETATFAGLYRPSDPPATGRRAALILHGMGAHMDWPGVISSLRMKLPERGWATLSIQLPVLPPQQSLSDYGTTLTRSRSRIQSAITWLQQNGYHEITLIGYSFGASIAVNYLATHNRSIRAFAGISMQEFPFLDPPLRLIDRLAEVGVPGLDIYGSADYTDVLRSVDDRRLAANQGGNDTYQQLVVNDADHYFSGRENELVDRIVEWLDTVISE